MSDDDNVSCKLEPGFSGSIGICKGNKHGAKNIYVQGKRKNVIKYQIMLKNEKIIQLKHRIIKNTEKITIKYNTEKDDINSSTIPTCHHILWGCITISSHHSGRHMSFPILKTIFGKSKIKKLCIVILE